MTARAPDTIYPPGLLRREQAARYCAVSPTTFDGLVRDGFLPQPRLMGNVKVWVRQELEGAFFDLPTPDGEKGGNTCDAVFG